jgi:UDP-N-acetylglucosamine 2-epimerase (non-hydrolysing)
MKVIVVAGARPNFIKIAPLCVELQAAAIPYEIFYSGQHYDKELCEVFKQELDLNDGYQADIQMTGNAIVDIQRIMVAFHDYLKKQPSFSHTVVVVVGDVNTTYACALVANRLQFPLIHLEAGLRSFDQTMPEEMNRITVDHLSNILLAPSEDAIKNLKDEGLTEGVHLVGNIMIDSLIRCVDKIKKEINETPFPFPKCVVTFHRPENVDNKEVLSSIIDSLRFISVNREVWFPIHPRTKAKLKEFGLKTDRLHVCSPLSYMDFLRLVLQSEFVLTDSGGIQEETSYLGIPCLTVRKNTERPITIKLGTNRLISYKDIDSEILKLKKKEVSIPLWDGWTAKRVVQILKGK